ncbi:molybdopterin molybdotransferase MoeA [Novosphingobium sp. Gsoil 351]|uniref:molybdopterin molybdotransferase MoeA n=1 Tax=Novosphingobium sp. Gsoil 351 TaxID=2675225 RepID=UPI0012B4AFFA|nr:molybdopterin molybdotransferase MoeA [Novosphingobium sp. Gsoil 351]QGN53904.1 molybdopterin molybdenumtransferase MoeA [Novosphingobium sp. Gsoil 351]
MKPPPLSLDEAQARLLALAPALSVEHRSIEDCAGFYLAEPLTALRTQPAAAMSAMDGYAVRAGESGPWRVIGESAAGRPLDRPLRPGEVARISTGAIVPEGADRVLLQEDCTREGETLRHLQAAAGPGRHVRRAGLDFGANDLLLPAGTRIGAAQLALAIAAGHQHLAVRRPARLIVIDCGDELVPPGVPGLPHHLPASNAPMLAALVAGLPIEIRRLGPIPDRLEALAEAFETARPADIVVTSGGASVGDHDLIRPALAHAGARIDFWRVKIKPGKPLLVARRPNDGGSQIVLGLPGNPASAFVTGFLFMLPLLRAALGAAQPLPRCFPARLAAPLPPGGKRMEFLRARWADGEVTAGTEQDSGALRPLAHANALICRAIDAPAATAGDIVPIYWLENGGIA